MATIEHNGFTIVDGVLQLGDFLEWRDFDLRYCLELTELPAGLRVGSWRCARSLNLEGCSKVTSLPEDLRVSGTLDLRGCTSLKELPDDLRVTEFIRIANLYLYRNAAIVLRTPLPESIRTAAIGRRLGDLTDHWALSWNGMRDQIIESIEEDAASQFVRLQPHASDA